MVEHPLVQQRSLFGLGRDLGEAAAIVERPGAKLTDRGAEGKAFQAAAIGKRPVADGDNPVGNVDFDNVVAAEEGQVPDSGEGVGQLDADDVAESPEGAVSQARHTIGSAVAADGGRDNQRPRAAERAADGVDGKRHYGLAAADKDIQRLPAGRGGDEIGRGHKGRLHRPRVEYGQRCFHLLGSLLRTAAAQKVLPTCKRKRSRSFATLFPMVGLRLPVKQKKVC